MKGNVAFICDKELVEECDRNPGLLEGRASIVFSLIHSYGLLEDVVVLPSRLANEEELMSFHSVTYVNYLKDIQESSDIEKLCSDEDLEECGLGYDCPLLPRPFSFIQRVAGGSLAAAQALIDNVAPVAVNWFGGWHHAQRDGASGFCYVNDIVLAIQHLRKKFDRVLYIDLDIHHGDGVENAFSFTQKVVTVSLHHFADGYFPGTGSIDDIGLGKGKYHSVNVPLEEGITDDLYLETFKRVVLPIQNAFQPDAVVVQCGADGLTGDPLGLFNLTPVGLGNCLQEILSWNKPTLALGGGGYSHPNTARCWAYLTSVIVEKSISSDIPEHEYFPLYGPHFELHIDPGLRPDKNCKTKIEQIIKKINENGKNIVMPTLFDR